MAGNLLTYEPSVAYAVSLKCCNQITVKGLGCVRSSHLVVHDLDTREGCAGQSDLANSIDKL